MIYIGIDNGVTGSIGVVTDSGAGAFFLTPTIRQLSYTRSKKQFITRIDHDKIYALLKSALAVFAIVDSQQALAVIERPMVNPGRFKASASALRALESTLIAVERLSIPYEYIDSKKWQGYHFPKGTKGPDLKKASVDVGLRLFPKYAEQIEKRKDADGILIAEYARRNNGH
jgi:hypothetical protein